MEERENFYRFSSLLLDVGARVLREVFTFHHLGSNTLAAYLSLNKNRLTQLPEESVIRNVLFAHVSSSSLDNTTFKRETTDLTTIYNRLISPIPATQFAPNDLQQMIDKELKGPLQPDLENEITNMREKIEVWQRYGKNYVLGIPLTCVF
ncbi:hypothetical protein CHS0354_019504 [Potamilus streckersoni]|uniref:Uncharacterized protein n=1 Tax=Potamilus streckersoni TaxID=2493646 RepID=A0AAE0VVQ1_9BIVA|nr:hypothetical protein CHS0354_019504 [Potamilus streckersoni]